MHAPRSFVLSAFFGLLAGAALAEEGVSFEEKLLATIPKEVSVPNYPYFFFEFAPNGKNVAYAWDKKVNCACVVVGDKPGKEYEGVYKPWLFSPDGTTFAYVAKRGDKTLVVTGDKESDAFDRIDELQFTPDGKVSYLGRNDETCELVVGGEKINGMGNASAVKFTPDGRVCAYVSKRDGKSSVTVGGKRGEEFDDVAWLAISPDGSRVAYMAQQGKREFAVIDGKKGQEFDFVSEFKFSPDGSQVAYCAQSGGKNFVVVEGKQSAAFDTVMNPTFSANGKHLAFIAGSGDKSLIVVDGTICPSFDDVHIPAFSFDGSQVAYGVQDRMKLDSLKMPYGGVGFLVVGEQKSEDFDELGIRCVFSPDAKKVAFGARKGHELWWKVMDVK